MLWKIPPVIKIYEALGCLADGRIIVDENTAKVTSSSGNKVYDVVFDPDQNAIMANDNGSYWQGYLGYPAIAFLIGKGIIQYHIVFADALKGIPWKDINTRFNNDFPTSEKYIRELLV